MWIAPSNRPAAPRAARYYVVPAGTAVQADALMPMALSESVALNAFNPVEFSAPALSGQGVWIPPSNRRGAPRAVRYFIEPEGIEPGGIVTADAVSPIESLERLIGDLLEPIEILGSATNVIGETVARLEWLSTQRGDLPVPFESLARVVRDLAVQIENLSTGSVAAGNDSSLPIELTARLIADTGEPLAWVLSVTVTADPMSLTGGPFEIGFPTPRPVPVPFDISGIRIRFL
jgi:hypothetical protein